MCLSLYSLSTYASPSFPNVSHVAAYPGSRCPCAG
jgi:hypothetical protein